jgi:hypothetical protein
MLYLCDIFGPHHHFLYLVCCQMAQALHWHYTSCLDYVLFVKGIDGELSCGYAFRRVCWQCAMVCVYMYSRHGLVLYWPVQLDNLACSLQHPLSTLSAEILYITIIGLYFIMTTQFQCQ